MRDYLKNAKLYGIIDLGYVNPKDIEARTRQLLSGGVDILQLRAKNCPIENTLSWAHLIKPLCKKADIPFIVNDYPEIAKQVNADGVHIGQDDGSLSDVRKVVGSKMIVGRSTHSQEQALTALSDGFDYIGFGPLFPTPTKKGRPAIGLKSISDVENEVGSKIPVFCIGGLKPTNLSSVLSAGAKRVVVVSALLSAENPEAETARLKSLLF